MRWSSAFIPTLREDPAAAPAASHRLLLRAGYVRQLASGSFSILPLGERVRGRIVTILQEEMDAIGAQRFHLPALHPAEVWRRSGRWESMGDEMFRLKDRAGVDHCLGMTHEEVFTSLASEIASYRKLPQIWYQIQTKFRDEPRPKSGLLRVREFTMKDSYTFDIDEDGLRAGYERHRDAYHRIFSRCGLDAVPVVASSGAMGGSESTEFIVRSDAGEDFVISCPAGHYNANAERATSRLEAADDSGSGSPLDEFPTPGITTIDALAAFEAGAVPERQLKTLVAMVDGKPTVLVLRGDHELETQKLLDHLGSGSAQLADEQTTLDVLGARPGSLGPVAISQRVLVDPALRGRRGMFTGANRDGFHLRNVDVERDIADPEWVELRAIQAGDPCPECGRPLDRWRGIEVGHIFMLGTRYATMLGALVDTPDGTTTPIWMGSYGIGVERLLAAVVEENHDDKGITWPVTVAPYTVVVSVLQPKVDAVRAVGETLYEELRGAGIDVLLDDRTERPGIKFADADLVGIPLRITVGQRGVERDVVDLTDRASGQADELPWRDATEVVVQRLRQGVDLG